MQRVTRPGFCYVPSCCLLPSVPYLRTPQRKPSATVSTDLAAFF
jgi:hypothetical protein